MKTRTLALTSAAALAGAILFAAAPSVLARGGSGGGRSGDTNGDNTADAPPPSDGPNPGSGSNFGSGPGDRGNGIDGEDGRDGEEQDRIARDAIDGRARADFRGLRDARNRRAAEPARDGSRR